MITISTIGARLDRLPPSKVHYKILSLIALGMFLDGFDMYLAGGVLGVLVKSGWSNVNLNALFVSATFIGLLIGSLAAGFVADHLGRKFAYQFNLLIFGLGSLAAALAPNMTWLIIFRCIMGIGLGAEIVIGYASFSEFAPAQTRGKWAAKLSFLTNLSVPVSALLGYLIIPSLGWRWMFGIAGIGAMIVWILRKNLPESPRWYASKGQIDKADEVVSALEKAVEAEKGIKLSAITDDVIDDADNKNQGSFWDLFKGTLLTRTIVAGIMLIGINTAIFSFVTWLPTIFLKDGINVSKSLGYTAVMMIGAPLGAFLGIFILDKLGRKWTAVGLLTIASILGYVYALQRTTETIVFIGFCLTTLLYILVSLVMGIYVPELFPTNIRFRGVGFAHAFGRLATIFSPYGVALLLNNFGAKSVFIAISGILIFVALVIAALGVETKQKSLEELSKSISYH